MAHIHSWLQTPKDGETGESERQVERERERVGRRGREYERNERV